MKNSYISSEKYLIIGKKMANEKITEDIVRSHFKMDPLFSVIKWEEQKSMNKRVVDVLQ